MIWNTIKNINLKKGEQERISYKTKEKGNKSQTRVYSNEEQKWEPKLKKVNLRGLRKRDSFIVKENKLIGLTERGKIINQIRIRTKKIAKRNNIGMWIKNIRDKERRERIKITDILKRRKEISKKEIKEKEIRDRYKQISIKPKIRKDITENAIETSIKIKGRIKGLKKRKIKIIINSFKKNRIEKLVNIRMKKNQIINPKEIEISYNKTGIITIQRQ